MAVVTGAASGFGEATARLSVGNGARVAVDGLAQERAEAVARSLGEDKALAVRADVSSRADIDRLPAAVNRRFGPPDIVGLPVDGGRTV